MIVEVPVSRNKYIKAEVVDEDDKYYKVKYVEPEFVNELGNKPVKYRKSVVKKVATKSRIVDGRIIPNLWTSIISQSLINWVNQVFVAYRLKEEKRASRNSAGKRGGFELRPFQKFIRDYMQLASPYRGILLYHQMGSGKTCTSIAVAEDQKDVRNILVLSPASLRQNYIYQLINICGHGEYKNNPKLIDDYYTFIAYNAPNTLEQLDAKVPNLDNHIIIIDEVHNLISMILNPTKKGGELYRRLMGAKNCKIIALSGTPIINYPIEIAILANILRGYIEVAMFQIVAIDASNYEDSYMIGDIMTKLGALPNVEFAHHQGKNIGLFLTVKSYEPSFGDVLRSIEAVSANHKVKLRYEETKEYELFPTDEDVFHNFFVKETKDGDELKNGHMLMRRLQGLMSYYRGGHPRYYPTVRDVQIIDVPMSDYQFQTYKQVREAEMGREKSKAVKKILQGLGKAKTGEAAAKKASSLFRVFSRQFSNFVFPPEIERPFIAKFIEASKKKKAAKNATAANATAEDEQVSRQSRVESDEVPIKDREIIDKAIAQLRGQKDKYLRNVPDGLQKYSPKMAKMIDIIKKTKGLILVYSAFRSLEGLEIFSLALEANGFVKYVGGRDSGRDRNKKHDEKRYAIWSGAESIQEREDILQKYNDKDNKYGENIKILMTTSAGAEGLDLKNIRAVLIMDPYWHDVRAQQVAGRANRFMSHMDLPEKDRTVDVYRFHTVFTKSQASLFKEDMTTDQYMYDLAQKKLKFTNDIKQVIKDVAIDCKLNAFDNEKTINCFSYPLDARGLAYLPDLKDDLVYGQMTMTKNVNVNLKPMLLTADGQILFGDSKTKKFYEYVNKLKKKPVNKPTKFTVVGVDTVSGNVYDLASAQSGAPILLGTVTKDGKYISAT